ncbi:unnamed protein product [Diamesa serratosioi]
MKRSLSLSSNETLENAVLKIMKSNSGKQYSTFYVIENSLESKEFTSKLFVDGLLNSSKATIYEDQRQLIENVNNTRSFSLIIVEDLASFKNVLQYITPGRFHFGGYFLIVLRNGNDEEIQTIFELLWKKYIYNVDILFVINDDNDDLVNLITFMPFNEVSCGNTTPILINQFNKSTDNWNCEEFFPKKFTNFYHCPIKIVAFESTPAVMIKFTKNQSYEITGIEIDLIKKMSTIFNFSIDLSLSEPGNYGEVFENGSGTGSMEMVMNGKVDMMLGGMYLTEVRWKHMSSSEFYETDPMVLIIPRGQQFSPLEKLFRPFNIVLWICLISTFILGICVISIVSCQSIEVRNLVLGRQIRNPFMNFMIAIVGGSQHVLPKRNFSRVLLMFFLLFCLVIRSLYVGGLFNFLQSDQRANEISTLDELNKNDFTIYMHQGISKLLSDLIYFKKREIIQFKDYVEYRAKTFDPSFKGAITSDQMNIAYYNKLNHRNNTLNACKEYVINPPLVFYFTKNFYLVETFSLLTKSLKEAGVIDIWYSKYVETKFLDFKKPKQGPQKLSFNHLLGGFQMYLFGILISTLLMHIWNDKIDITLEKCTIFYVFGN